MIRFIVADDHPIVRKGFIAILEAQPGFQCVAQGANASEVMKAIRDIAADVVVLDVSMPGKNGIDVLKQIKKEKPRLPVLILSTHPEDQYAVRAIRAGAAGYLNKDIAPTELVEAIRTVADGRRFITPALAERLANVVEHPHEGLPHESLSDREFQTLRLIGQGQTLSQIADTLCLSVKTVSVYRARLLDKMQLQNNAELARYAIEHGLID